MADDDPTGTLATIRWLPIDQYEMDGKDVLLRWRHGYVMRGSGKAGRSSRDGMPLDGRDLPRVEGRGPLMFARLPLKDGIAGAASDG
jgi:hypothetical protein